ncbi:MAG: aspartate aminotransferase family protein [Chitinispirillaceae bacterium]|jgi:acetylornithine/N-succinyldiaminopimelate aminotransferase
MDGACLLNRSEAGAIGERHRRAVLFNVVVFLTGFYMTTFNYNSLFVNTFSRSGPPFVKGKGMYLYDAAEKKFLDFGTGIAVNALGHADPLIVKELKKQGSSLLHVSNHYITPSQIKLARLLIEHSFGDRVFLCNSGTEANEGAIKFARKRARTFSEEKYHVLSFSDCFHGRTYGALSATAQAHYRHGFEPMVPGFHYAPFNNLKTTINLLERHEFAAIMVEPLQAEGGVNVIEEEFLRNLRNYADENRICLIFDEVQCGMGRTGTLWCYEHFGIEPDIMTVAKPIGGGIPLGAIVCREEMVDCIKPGDHGTTFGGNPLACALGCVVLDRISKKSFLKQVLVTGNYLSKKLCAVKAKHPVVKEIRGLGLLVGVRTTVDPSPIVMKCRELGLLLIKAEHNTIRFLPPLIVSREDIDKATAIFEMALRQL